MGHVHGPTLNDDTSPACPMGDVLRTCPMGRIFGWVTCPMGHESWSATCPMGRQSGVNVQVPWGDSGPQIYVPWDINPPPQIVPWDLNPGRAGRPMGQFRAPDLCPMGRRSGSTHTSHGAIPGPRSMSHGTSIWVNIHVPWDNSGPQIYVPWDINSAPGIDPWDINLGRAARPMGCRSGSTYMSHGNTSARSLTPPSRPHFRIWVTGLRPSVFGRGQHANNGSNSVESLTPMVRFNASIPVTNVVFLYLQMQTTQQDAEGMRRCGGGPRLSIHRATPLSFAV
jgi:hypothetical protein